MNIRSRTAATLTSVGLGAATAVHLAWAAGSSWPAADRDSLADLVVGVRPFPSTAMTLGVVAALGAGIAVVEGESRREPVGAATPDSAYLRGRRAAAYGVPGVLALRGVAGLVASGCKLGPGTPEFRRWDLRLYSPLCLALACAAAVAVWPASAAGPQSTGPTPR